MAEAKTKSEDKVEYAKIGDIGTSELLSELKKYSEGKREAVEKANREYKFPATYNSKMGKKEGHVTELRLFFKVKPGHAEALKKELLKFRESEERNSKAAHIITGIQSMTCTLFDNDTRYCHATEFDTDWDPYIDDSVPTEKQQLIYANWLQHLEEAGDFGPDKIPSSNDIKVLFNQQRETATVFIRTFGDTVTEELKMRDLKKAFDQVLDHPDAATALAHPALKPLLEFAAD